MPFAYPLLAAAAAADQPAARSPSQLPERAAALLLAAYELVLEPLHTHTQAHCLAVAAYAHLNGVQPPCLCP